MSDNEKKEKNFGSIYDLPLQNASALAPDIQKRTLYGPENFWKDYVMRHFILPPHKGIPAHVHEWDHLMFTISGNGAVIVDEADGEKTPYEMKTGYWTRVPGGLVHEYRNDADIPLEFFCIVPTCGDPHAKKFSMRAERAKRKEKDA
ncbi:MAG: cupin domain-containing protein [Synergistes sp.]|nr:cupin domain-containing protein [Synergistes sp.]